MGRSIVNFETALTALKKGKKIIAEDWNENERYLVIEKTENNDFDLKIDIDCIYYYDVGNRKVPWNFYQSDLLRINWIILD